MNARDRELVAELCATRAGLFVDLDKAYLIENRLAPVARQSGHGSVHDLIAAVRDRGEERLAWTVVEAMSPSETAFFRDPAALDAVVDQLFADFVPGRQGEPVRIWAASCGAGQEVYSLAMLLDERAPKGAEIDLYASDLSERRLEKAQAGAYSQFEAQRGLSARRLVRHFEPHPEGFALCPRLRRTVRWGRMNLMDDLARLGRFDLIVCRQQLGSLLPDARAKIAANLTAALKTDGTLLLGTGETVAGLAGEADQPGVFRSKSGHRAAA